MSRKASYILLSAIVLAVVGIIIIALAPDSYRCRQFYSAIISLTVFYTALNAFSLNFHGIISKQKNAYLTQFIFVQGWGTCTDKYNTNKYITIFEQIFRNRHFSFCILRGSYGC